ncbi:MAG TPA: hypothetical protein PLE30_09010 [Candidatus Kapabacteria bacterium]|nr:hypothetical protein [Candidatus Kapabacteria bacterium]
MIESKIIDLLMFRLGSEGDNFGKVPIVTIGSIVWGVILRATIVIVVVSALLTIPQFRDYWWFSFFAIWFFVAFPAYQQYQIFQNRIDELEEDTLCGSCVHFRKESQMCSLYDEHISKDYIPCEGKDWEPKSTFDRD